MKPAGSYPLWSKAGQELRKELSFPTKIYIRIPSSSVSGVNGTRIPSRECSGSAVGIR